MGATSSIEWTDATWTPLRARNIASGKIGWHCEHVTEGCRNCYAERLNMRLGTQLPFKPGHRKDIEIFLDPKMLTAPLRWRRPRMVFPWSMSDLFGDFVTDAMLDQAFAVMAVTRRHTYQALTKRPNRAQRYITDPLTPYRIARNVVDFLIDGTLDPRQAARLHEADAWPVASEGDPDDPSDITLNHWPLPNVWLGVSIHDQASADSFVPALLRAPAAKRFVSAEPLLGEVDLTKVDHERDRGWGQEMDALRVYTRAQALEDWGDPDDVPAEDRPRIDWVIAGGESGQEARPMHPDWVRALRDRCVPAGVAFFFKQWGEWLPMGQAGFTAWTAANVKNNGAPGKKWLGTAHLNDGAGGPESSHIGPRQTINLHGDILASRVGKRAAGRLLDGREWNELPDFRPILEGR